MDSRSYNSFDGIFKKTKIVVASITYIVDLDAYELHPGMERSSMILLMNYRVLHDTNDRGSLLFKSVFVYLC